MTPAPRAAGSGTEWDPSSPGSPEPIPAAGERDHGGDGTLSQRAARGVVWTFLSFGGDRVITLLTTLVLARLLLPDDFGVVSLAGLVISFLALFQDLGLSATLVSRPDLDSRAIGTLFTMSVVMSGVIAALIAAAGAPMAAFFDEPRLREVLPVLAVTVLITAVGGFYDAYLQRELRFRTRFYGHVIPVAGYAVVAIALAALGAGVWSLVIGQLVKVVIFAVLLVLLAPTRVRPGFDFRIARGLFSVSRGFLLQSGVAFVHMNAATMVIGRMLGSTQVGHYTMAYRMAELPTIGIAEPVSSVTFPAFARMRLDGEDVGAPYLSAMSVVALVTAPLGVMLSAAAEPFTAVVLGDRWTPVIPLLWLLGVWAAIRPVQSISGWFLNSMGQPGVLGVVSLCIVALLLPALALGAHLGGLPGIGVVMIVDVLVTQVVLTRLVGRRCGVPARRQWRALRTVALAAAVCWVATWLPGVLLAGVVAAPLVLTACVVAGAAGYLAVIAVVEPALLRTARAQLVRMIGARARS